MPARCSRIHILLTIDCLFQAGLIHALLGVHETHANLEWLSRKN
jgi:hypothetical protein